LTISRYRRAKHWLNCFAEISNPGTKYTAHRDWSILVCFYLTPKRKKILERFAFWNQACIDDIAQLEEMSLKAVENG